MSALKIAVGEKDVGGQIAFMFNAFDGNIEIYVVDADGSNPQNLTDNQGDDTDPALSPDGRQVAFVFYEDGGAEVYVMNINGTDLQPLIDNDARDSYPAWLPDGTEIVFVSD